MKRKIALTFILLFMLIFSLNAATYKGQSIDSVEYSCLVYSHEDQTWYEAKVVFDDDMAIITFSDEDMIALLLDNKVIEDPNNIEGFDIVDYTSWTISIDKL